MPPPQDALRRDLTVGSLMLHVTRGQQWLTLPCRKRSDGADGGYAPDRRWGAAFGFGAAGGGGVEAGGTGTGGALSGGVGGSGARANGAAGGGSRPGLGGDLRERTREEIWREEMWREELRGDDGPPAGNAEPALGPRLASPRLSLAQHTLTSNTHSLTPYTNSLSPTPNTPGTRPNTHSPALSPRPASRSTTTYPPAPSDKLQTRTRPPHAAESRI